MGRDQLDAAVARDLSPGLWYWTSAFLGCWQLQAEGHGQSSVPILKIEQGPAGGELPAAA